MMGIGAAQMALASPDAELTEEQRATLRAALPGIQEWVITTDFLSSDTARQALTLIADAARATGVSNLDQLKMLSFEEVLAKAGNLLAASKRAVRLYGLDIDAILASTQVEVLEIAGTTARVRTTVGAFDAPLSKEIELVLIDGRWYGKDATDKVHFHIDSGELRSIASLRSAPGAPRALGLNPERRRKTRPRRSPASTRAPTTHSPSFSISRSSTCEPWRNWLQEARTLLRTAWWISASVSWRNSVSSKASTDGRTRSTIERKLGDWFSRGRLSSSTVAETAPQRECPRTTISRVPKRSAANSALPICEEATMLPATRMTNIFPKPARSTISAGTRESEQPRMMANGAWPSASSSRCARLANGALSAPRMKRRLPACSRWSASRASIMAGSGRGQR